MKATLKILQRVDCSYNQSGSNRTPKVFFFLWHTLHLAVFQGRISEFMTKALTTTWACWDSFSYSSADLMARTHTHLNTEWEVEAKLYLQRRGRLERQAHYAVRDILYHWLTFIMLNLPQTPVTQPVLQMQSSLPPAIHCHSHVYRQRLMGVEHSVTVLPCIKKPCSWKVQDKWCLPSDTLTTCQSDSLLFRSGRKGTVPKWTRSLVWRHANEHAAGVKCCNKEWKWMHMSR